MTDDPTAPSDARSPENFYRRSMRASVLVGVVGTLFASVYAGPAVAWRYALFVAWMLANLMVWGFGLREILGPRRPRMLVLAGTAKVVWLALLVGLCAWTEVGANRGNFFAFLLGFNTPFLVMSLKAGGQALTQRQLASAEIDPGKTDKTRLPESTTDRLTDE